MFNYLTTSASQICHPVLIRRTKGVPYQGLPILQSIHPATSSLPPLKEPHHPQPRRPLTSTPDLPHKPLHPPRLLRPPKPPIQKHVPGPPIHRQEPQRLEPKPIIVLLIQHRSHPCPPPPRSPIRVLPTRVRWRKRTATGEVQAPDQPREDEIPRLDERGGDEREGGGGQPDEYEADAASLDWGRLSGWLFGALGWGGGGFLRGACGCWRSAQSG